MSILGFEEWQLERRHLAKEVEAERSRHWQSGHAPLQVAVTEYAIRKLYGEIAELKSLLDQKTRPGKG